MPWEWPFVARAAEIELALEAVEGSSFSGVIFTGEAGVGKSALARQVGERLGGRGMQTHFVLATQTSRDVPLAAFAGIVRISSALEPIGLLAAAHEALDDAHDLLLVVDDAHLLDPLSAIVVHQLAVRGSATLIVTIRAGVEVPDAVTALWKDHYLRRIDVGALSREETERLTIEVLGGPVSGTLVDQLYELSSGNPLLLRSLLDTASDDGLLTDDTGWWRLTQMPRLGSDVEQLFDARVRGLPPAEREVLEIISAAEVLDWDALRTMCDADAISDAERRAVIEVINDPQRVRVQVAHPALADVVRKRCGAARLRQINTALAQHFWALINNDDDGGAARDPRLVIEYARLMMNSDATPDLSLVIDAAESAMAMSSLALAEQLARSAYDNGGGLRAAIPLADALAWQGRNQEAEELLAAFDPRDEVMLVRWGCLRATNLFFGCGQRAVAEEVLGTVRSRVTLTVLRSYALAVEASIAYFSGDLDTAAAASSAVIADPEAMPMAVLWAAVPAAAVANFRGRPDGVAAAASRGNDAARHCASGPQRYAISLTETLSALNQGDIVSARAIVERQRHQTYGAPHAEAIVAAMAGRVELAAGNAQAASDWLQRALSAMVSTLSGGWVNLVATWAVQAEVLRGDSAAAARAFSTAEASWAPAVEVFRPLLEVARAYLSAASGDFAAAHTYIGRSADAAARSGMIVGELEALHTGLRFGMAPDVSRFKALAEQLNSPVAKLAAAHAEAVAAHDGVGLDRVAGGWEALRMRAHAADTFAAAAVAHRRAGARLLALQSSTRAHWLVSTSGLHTPATAVTGMPLPLSDREREIAALVADGLSNRQIADRLVVSVRTVEGHLYRVYNKLGINDREQLVRLIRTVDPDAPATGGY
ncbi:LuxR C-terminal-related transcriptional regulator [Mycolicibacterium aichiense]|uniref:helix-turn-helix transcriptional regulator n=1 Tax=Mycolicibacterium aichiense TaxID=1799 RepID=UPI003D66AB49